jgi:hypothetical protein
MVIRVIQFGVNSGGGFEKSYESCTLFSLFKCKQVNRVAPAAPQPPIDADTHTDTDLQGYNLWRTLNRWV